MEQSLGADQELEGEQIPVLDRVLEAHAPLAPAEHLVDQRAPKAPEVQRHLGHLGSERNS